YVSEYIPDLRESLINELRTRFNETTDTGMAAYLVNALCGMWVKEIYNDVMVAYRAGRIDQKVLRAATVRQVLLGPSKPNLSDVQLSFWERYDTHGPFEDDTQ
ncbi:MAG: hypothetical protein MUD01_22670, partial [Chloroflexaceae bacterium]|nr:hypothetical protein [Chloroflexaceae bacterium]